MAKRIAVITTWYPPQQSIATQRMSALVDYLSKHYQITVFALDHRQHIVQKESIEVRYHRTYAFTEILKSNTADNALLHKAKTALRIVISKFIKSPLKRWKEATQADFLQQHQQRAFDLVISSYAPAETHEVVLHVKKQFPNLPWIADMRDEMSNNAHLLPHQFEAMRQLEERINEHAQAITSVSLPIVKTFERLCPKVKHFAEIRNGFNHSFKRDTTTVSNDGPFRMGYFGTFYGTRKPHVLLAALKELPLDFTLELFGVHHNFDIPKELATRVRIHEPLPYAQAIEAMARMHANIQLHPRSDMKGVYTGKLFDYISVQVPVIALVDTDDVAADLIREFNCGYIAEFDDLEQNKQALLQAYTDWQNKIQRIASDEQVASLHREKQLEKLVPLIDELCA